MYLLQQQVIGWEIVKYKLVNNYYSFLFIFRLTFFLNVTGCFFKYGGYRHNTIHTRKKMFFTLSSMCGTSRQSCLSLRCWCNKAANDQRKTNGTSPTAVNEYMYGIVSISAQIYPQFKHIGYLVQQKLQGVCF